MYFTTQQITRSIAALSRVHPFHGITFLACKRAQLPVSEPMVFALDSVTDQFLRDHHKLDPGSDWFFQPYKSIKKWVRPDYAPKGLQAVNTGSFLGAFIHEHNSRIWAWDTDYVSFLADKLPKGFLIPAFHLAVWLYRDFDWSGEVSTRSVVKKFLADFHISDYETQHLFNVNRMTIPYMTSQCFRRIALTGRASENHCLPRQMRHQIKAGRFHTSVREVSGLRMSLKWSRQNV